MDFITGLPPIYFNGKDVDAILVIVDRFTKYMMFFPVSVEITAAELAELFHQEVELRFGAPRGVVSDRGSLFTSSFWSEVCFQSKIKRRLSTAFHPQTDGQTERINQVLEHYLRCFVGESLSTWPRLLRTAQFAANASVNASTGMSAHMALMGYNLEFHIVEDDSSERGVPDAAARVQRLHTKRKELQQHWEKASARMAQGYNQRHQDLSFKTGALVGLSTSNMRFKRGERKLQPRRVGPFRVL